MKPRYLLWIACALIVTRAWAAGPEKPNIVFILAEQHNLLLEQPERAQQMEAKLNAIPAKQIQ